MILAALVNVIKILNKLKDNTNKTAYFTSTRPDTFQQQFLSSVQLEGFGLNKPLF